MNPIIPEKKYGGNLPALIISDISSQLKDRLLYLRESHPERNYSHRTIAELMGTGKAWISDFFLCKYSDVRVSSLHRLATVLGCDIKFVLIPKEKQCIQMTIDEVNIQE